jgi:hypothetical protein
MHACIICLGETIKGREPAMTTTTDGQQSKQDVKQYKPRAAVALLLSDAVHEELQEEEGGATVSKT